MNFMSNLHSGGHLSGTPELIQEAAAGRMVILIDDEDRENEGDLVIPAQFANAEAVNFMARHGRGLICLALTCDRVRRLELPMMPRSRNSRFETAFTASIEAREGVTTGISAADRARTIAVAIDSQCGPEDLNMPGHVFPLVARDGGTLVRAGHTEAAVDLARLAGLNPAGVICEIMHEDGTMARMPELSAVAREHGIKMGTIADLIAHRRKTETLVERVATSAIHHPSFGEWRLTVYRDGIEGGEHLALTKGDLDRAGPALVKLHFADPVSDLFLRIASDPLSEAMFEIMKVGRGAIVVVNDARHAAISTRLLLAGSPHARRDPRRRDNGIGAQILADLGLEEVALVASGDQALVGVEGYGISVVDREHVRD